ncbi:hypothetical protein MRBLMR1_005920 [Neorhizobium sp. LMR1-1-1.1]
MRSLPLPPITFSDVLALCISGIADASLSARLNSISPTLNTSAETYGTLATSEQLHLVPRILSVGAVTKEELVNLYSDHLSATKGAARAVYDQIRNAAPNKKCPLCGVGTVGALDHHLPKSRYPDLSITPANLVPACHYCNDTKKAKFPKNAGEQTLHPYFDHRLIEMQWLGAVVDRGPPATLVFRAEPPSIWPAVDQQRVKRHVAACGLAVLYASNANDELPILKPTLAGLYDRGGPVPVQEHLEGERDRYRVRPNSWQFAMYDALSSDDWFVDEGFRNIA